MIFKCFIRFVLAQAAVTDTTLPSEMVSIPLSSFAGQPSSSIGIAFLKSYPAICMEGCVIVLACVIFSPFAATPPAISGLFAAGG